MKDSSTKGKAIGEVSCLEHEPKFCVGTPEPDGKGPKGNKSSAGGGPGQPSKSQRSGNRRKRNKGRS